MEYDPTQKAFAEFVGTFVFVFAVASSIAVGGQVAGIFGAAVAQGLAMGVMISSLGHVSGGHFNPVVTLGFLVTRRIEPALAVTYWLAQLAGGVAAALLVKALLPNALDSALGAPSLGTGISAWQGLLWEMVLTFFLVWVVFATAVDPKGTFSAIAGFGIGVIITVDILIGGTVTGASMNPARSFGPQLVQGFWGDAWIYYVGPIVGALVAAIGYTMLYLPMRRDPAPAAS
jgi:MIP family channel proteins